MEGICLVFPGQGSQKLGAELHIANLTSSSKKIFECASDIFGFDILNLALSNDSKNFSNALYSQAVIVTSSVAAFYCLRENGVKFDAVAGHSLGEYSAIIASEMLSLEEGFALVRERAKAMQTCCDNSNVKGVMCAIIGVSSDVIEKACNEVSGYVACANYNGPLQTIVSGEETAVKNLVKNLSCIAKRCVFLNVPAAFHSKLMEPAASIFEKVLNNFNFKVPVVDFYSNVTGNRIEDFSNFKELLKIHLTNPVVFTTELMNIEKAGVKTFIELGIGKTISGIVKKTLKEATVMNVENRQTLESTLKEIKNR